MHDDSLGGLSPGGNWQNQQWAAGGWGLLVPARLAQSCPLGGLMEEGSERAGRQCVRG